MAKPAKVEAPASNESETPKTDSETTTETPTAETPAKGKKGRKAKAFKFFHDKIGENLPEGVEVVEFPITLKRAIYELNGETKVDGKKVTKDTEGATVKVPEQSVAARSIPLPSTKVNASLALNNWLKHMASDGFDPLRFTIRAIRKAVETSDTQVVKRTKDPLPAADTGRYIPSVAGIAEVDVAKQISKELQAKALAGETTVSAEDAKKMFEAMLAQFGMTVKQ